MNSKETITRNCIEAKPATPTVTRAPVAIMRHFIEGVKEALFSLLPSTKKPIEAFVILSHYSNENIGEFNVVGLHGLYSSLDSAKKAADAMLKEDKENGCHGEAIPYTTDDCCNNGIFDDYPLYVAGVWEEDNFEAYHNLYAVFSCNLVP